MSARLLFSSAERERRRGRGKGRASSRGTSQANATTLDKRARLAFVLLSALFAVVLAGGGASRPDVLSLLYLRPLCALVLAILLVMVRPQDIARVRVPILLLACFAGWIALQLVPLPPDMWLSLPGRARFAEAAAIAEIDQPWRPLTLTPDLALTSLLSLVPAFAVLLAVGMLDERHLRLTVSLLICGASASIFVSILQVTGGATSPAFLYAVTHEGSAVGLFSNRNHQAAFLAATFVLLRVWSLAPAASRERAQLRNGIAIVFSIVLVPLIFVTGSRAGLVLALVGILAAGLVKPPALKLRTTSGKYQVGVLTLGTLLVTSAVYMVLFSSRSEAFRRLSTLQVEDDARVRNMSTVVDIMKDFLPFGAGLGSFDKVFRIYEVDSRLGPTYYNRAHNDLFELVLTGGLPALAILVFFLLWLARSCMSSVRLVGEPAHDLYRARGGLAVILIILAGSVVDYPLRTPLLTVVFAFAAGWIASHDAARRRQVHAPTDDADRRAQSRLGLTS